MPIKNDMDPADGTAPCHEYNNIDFHNDERYFFGGCCDAPERQSDVGRKQLTRAINRILPTAKNIDQRYGKRCLEIE